MTNAQLVQHVYDRFAHEDAAAILAVFDANVEFRLTETHPYNPNGDTWFGDDAVTRNFS